MSVLSEQNKSKGFTLIELMVVISIIAILAVVGVTVFSNVTKRARAAKIVSDLKAIQTAFNAWKYSTGSNWVHEDTYGTVNADAPCSDEVVLGSTDLFSNVSGASNWSGPYMSEEPKDPFGKRYAYDNDGDIYDPVTTVFGGVNIAIQSCDPSERSKYLELAPIIDEILDKGNGAATGSVNWNTEGDFTGLNFLIAPNGTE